MPRKNTICLWYDGTALDAAQFYARTFPDSAVGAVMHAPGDFPDGKQGDVLTVEFTVIGIPCLGLNGGPAFRPKPTACGTRLSETAARKARAGGVKTSGACRGRSRRACSSTHSPTPIARRPSVRSKR